MCIKSIILKSSLLVCFLPDYHTCALELHAQTIHALPCIGSDGAAALADMLKVNTTINVLDVSDNRW